MTSDMPVTPPTSEQPARAVGRRRRRISAKWILVLLIVAAGLWFILVNTQHVKVKLWVQTVHAPMWLVLLCTLAAGIILGWLLALRRRRPH